MGVKGEKADRHVSGKIAGLNPVQPLKLAALSWRKVGGMRDVAVKCIDITQNSD